MTGDFHKPGDVVEIKNSPSKTPYVRLSDEIRYDYENAQLRCPVCEVDPSMVPWRGWFDCGFCSVIALVKTGEVFIPIPAKRSV